MLIPRLAGTPNESDYSHLVKAEVRGVVVRRLQPLYADPSTAWMAFLIWTELVRNSARMVDAVPGLRRTARRMLRGAVFHLKALSG